MSVGIGPRHPPFVNTKKWSGLWFWIWSEKKRRDRSRMSRDTESILASLVNYLYFCVVGGPVTRSEISCTARYRNKYYCSQCPFSPPPTHSPGNKDYSSQYCSSIISPLSLTQLNWEKLYFSPKDGTSCRLQFEDTHLERTKFAFRPRITCNKIFYHVCGVNIIHHFCHCVYYFSEVKTGAYGSARKGVPQLVWDQPAKLVLFQL